MAAKPISPQMVSLGENVKMLCSFANVVLKSSFEEIQHFLKGLFNIHISDGEIDNILEKQGQRLLPQKPTSEANQALIMMRQAIKSNKNNKENMLGL